MRPAVPVLLSPAGAAGAGGACGVGIGVCVCDAAGAFAAAAGGLPAGVGPAAVGPGGAGLAAGSLVLATAEPGNRPELSREFAGAAASPAGLDPETPALPSGAAAACSGGICKAGGTAGARWGRVRSPVDR